MVTTLAPAPLVRAQTKQIQWASPTQGEAFRYGPYPQCLSGGWGSGKTHVCCLKAIWLSTEYRRNRGVIARYVGKELRETTMATFYKACHPSLYDRRLGGRRSDQSGYMRFAKSESEILFLHLDNPETEGILKGLEINWFLIDQAEENPDKMEEWFELLLGRLGRWDIAEVPAALIARETAAGRPWPYLHPESGKPTPPPYPMLCVNPDLETHWVYRRFHPDSVEHQQRYRAEGYRMFHMPSLENRFLGETNRRFLLAKDSAFIRRNVEGLWGMPEGAIHAIDVLSIVEGSEAILAWLRATCLLYRTLDHGDSSPTCCLWWAVTGGGDVIAYREYYQPNALVSTHRGNIAGLSEGERYELNLADPSIFHKMPQKDGGRWSVADEYEEAESQPGHTAIYWKPADNNEMGTRNRINEYLRVEADRVNPFTRTRGGPRLFFLKRSDAYPQGCYHVLRETRGQRRVKLGTDLGRPVFSDERDPDVVDHAYDTLRYMIASRPGVPPPAVEGNGNSFSAVRAAAIRARRGR